MSKTDDLIAELRVLVEKATQGYWGWDDDVPKKWSDADWEKVAPWLANQDLDCVLSGNIVAENPHDVGYIATCNPENMRALLSRITELEQSQRWISVDERLPDSDNCYVLVLCEGGNVDKTFFSLNRDFHRRAGNSYSRKDQGKLSGYFELSHKYGYKITHWLPLPGGI